MPEVSVQSLDQKRAAFAWEKVQQLDASVRRDYANLAKATPSLIMTNGLMQTLAFFQAKGEKHHQSLNQHLFEWLQKRFEPRIARGTFAEVMKALHGQDARFYLQATQEAMALLRWIRQFADALQGG